MSIINNFFKKKIYLFIINKYNYVNILEKRFSFLRLMLK